MTAKAHRVVLASLLAGFALLDIGVGIGMLQVIPFHEFELDAFARTVGWVIYAAVILTIALFAVQLLAAALLFRGSEDSKTWGLVGSAIAILGGVSLPVGVYGLWLLTSSASGPSSSDDSRAL